MSGNLALAAIVAGQVLICTPTAVYDGDGPIWCEATDGKERVTYKIRLSGIAAREIDDTCRPNQPCPKASGIAARDNLVKLLGGPRGRLSTGHIALKSAPLRCRVVGTDRYGRVDAFCALGNVDLSCAQVRARVALRWARYGGDRVCRRQ